MNRSYKLFDTSWDGCCCPTNKPHIMTNLPNGINGTKVLFSSVLKDGLTKEKDGRDRMTFLIIDYFPQSKTPCVVSYYIKRLLQIINQFSGCICVCDDGVVRELLNNSIESIYYDRQD